MRLSKEEVAAMIKDAHKTADKSLGEKIEWSVKASQIFGKKKSLAKKIGRKIEWAVEERLYQLLGDEPYERIRNWICVEPVSNGLAILLAVIIIIID